MDDVMLVEGVQDGDNEKHYYYHLSEKENDETVGRGKEEGMKRLKVYIRGM